MTPTDTISQSLEKAEAAEAAAISALGKRSGPNIAVINQSTVASDADIERWVTALQIQISRDFMPLWGFDATLHFVPTGGKSNPSHWSLIIGNTSDQISALGYHEVSQTGLPLGFVFAQSDLSAGASVSVTLSHEGLEMLGDPLINLCTQIDAGTFAACENCDVVEADSDGYAIDGVELSNFVLPNYFTPGSSGPWDFRKLLTGPVPVIRPLGYLSIWTPTGGWTQRDGELIQNGPAKLKASSRPKPGSRRMRRMLPRDKWLKSEI